MLICGDFEVNAPLKMTEYLHLVSHGGENTDLKKKKKSFATRDEDGDAGSITALTLTTDGCR